MDDLAHISERDASLRCECPQAFKRGNRRIARRRQTFIKSDAVPLAIMSEAERRSFGRDFAIGELVLVIDSNDRMRTCFFRSPFE